MKNAVPACPPLLFTLFCFGLLRLAKSASLILMLIPFAKPARAGALLMSLLVLIAIGCHRVQAAGVTIITHGFSGNADGWVLGMAGGIPGHPDFPGTNVICYEVTASYSSGFVVTSRKLAGGSPLTDPTAEIAIKLDWGPLAGFFSQYDTYEVAAAVVPKIVQANFIPELGGHTLAELPLHFIGHSRGGSLVCEMAGLLGINGIWVDQVTTLDPHPVNNDGNSDPLFVVDAPLRIYDNVLFADNYYQDFGGYPHGQFMPSSYNRELTALPGGYSSAHSDTHLWYHATLDFHDPADDSEALLYGSERIIWFTPYELTGGRAGFHYSRLGGGDRLSVSRPAGAGSDFPAYGYNQRWNLGPGNNTNRTPLWANNGNWGSLIRLNLAGTNLMAQGQSNFAKINYQWAKPASSNATIGLFLDPDLNPFNGNGALVHQSGVPGTTSNAVAISSLALNVAATNTTPGIYNVYGSITGGGRTRYLYAPERLTIFSSFDPPHLAISRQPSGGVRVEVNGIAGRRIVLQRTEEFKQWQSVATNWLGSNGWEYADEGVGKGFYRAVVQ